MIERQDIPLDFLLKALDFGNWGPDGNYTLRLTPNYVRGLKEVVAKAAASEPRIRELRAERDALSVSTQSIQAVLDNEELDPWDKLIEIREVLAGIEEPAPQEGGDKP